MDWFDICPKLALVPIFKIEVVHKRDSFVSGQCDSKLFGATYLLKCSCEMTASQPHFKVKGKQLKVALPLDFDYKLIVFTVFL